MTALSRDMTHGYNTRIKHCSPKFVGPIDIFFIEHIVFYKEIRIIWIFLFTGRWYFPLQVATYLFIAKIFF